MHLSKLTFSFALTLLIACAHTPPAAAVEVELTERQVMLSGPVTDTTVSKIVKEILQFDAQSADPIWLLMDSPGGSVEAGLVLIDVMKSIRSPIYCIVISKAFSMGAIITVFAKKRLIFPHATMMFHEASYGAIGEDPSIRSRIEFSTRYLDGLHVEIAKAIGMPLEKYRKRIRDAWWVMADEAVKEGVIEAIVTKVSYREQPEEQVEVKRTRTHKSRLMIRPTDEPAPKAD
jgi:ATP-dependent Clp protease protease subunit